MFIYIPKFDNYVTIHISLIRIIPKNLLSKRNITAVILNLSSKCPSFWILGVSHNLTSLQHSCTLF